jgi:heptosyltransferase III
LGLRVDDLAARIFPSDADRNAVEKLLGRFSKPVVVFHPGSGSEKKNWPLENWIDIGNHLLDSNDLRGSLVVVSGEADQDRVRPLRAIWKNESVRFASNFPLPGLAALFQDAIFLGHDSGISHLAAAAGANCILLFGPTNPDVWVPMNENVQVIRGADGKIDNIEVAVVEEAMAALAGCDRWARRMRKMET